MTERHALIAGRLAVTVEPWLEHQPDDDSREIGTRVEVRRVDGDTLGEPVWRADLFALIGGPPGNFDRAHYHPSFVAGEPVTRRWDPRESGDPVGWAMARLADPAGILEEAGASDLAGSVEVDGLRSGHDWLEASIRRALVGPAGAAT